MMNPIRTANAPTGSRGATHPLLDGSLSSEGRAQLGTLFGRLVRICLGYSCAAIVVAGLLINFGLTSHVKLPTPSYKGLVTVVVTLVLLTVDFLALRWLYRPIHAFEHAAERQEHGCAEKALVRLLNFPLFTVIRVMCLHGPVALGTVTFLHLQVGNRFFGTTYTFTDIVILWSTLFVIVPAHAIFEYFAVQSAVRPVLRVAVGQGERWQQAMRFGIRKRLLASSVFITVVPLAILGFTVLLKVHGVLGELAVSDPVGQLKPIIHWTIALILFSSLVTVSIAVLVTRDIGELITALVRSMGRVEAGDLETRLEVTSTDEFANLYHGFNHMTDGLRERRRLQDAFGRYISPEIAARVMQNGVQLGGASIHATILFADIRGFTNLSEKMKAQEIVALLNGYFSAVGPAIDAQGGWINKFGGDSLLAIFGAPVAQPDHAQRAVRAALAMRQALAEFNAAQERQGAPTLRIGIGVHSGWLVAGNVGSPERMEYTVIGDAVNMAARIQALNKGLGTDILISAEVYQAIDKDIVVREMPPSEVQGKSMPLRIYALE